MIRASIKKSVLDLRLKIFFICAESEQIKKNRRVGPTERKKKRDERFKVK